MLCYPCCRDYLKKDGEGRTTKCPTCCSSCNHSELTYVCGRRLGEEGRGGEEREGRGGEERAAAASTGSSKALEEEDEVKGSYSTKIVALGIAVPWYH
jgi:hypothetical protein